MATIGTFTANGNGFTGTNKTLSLNVRASIIRADRMPDKGPDFRVLARNVEFGAAWRKTAKETEREHLSVKLDDPSFRIPSTPR